MGLIKKWQVEKSNTLEINGGMVEIADNSIKPTKFHNILFYKVPIPFEVYLNGGAETFGDDYYELRNGDASGGSSMLTDIRVWLKSDYLPLELGFDTYIHIVKYPRWFVGFSNRTKNIFTNRAYNGIWIQNTTNTQNIAYLITYKDGSYEQSASFSFSQDTWHNVKFRVYSDRVECYVDDSLVATNTSYLPINRMLYFGILWTDYAGVSGTRSHVRVRNVYIKMIE